MIFIGDIACPQSKIEKFIDCIQNIKEFKNETIVLNLESNILEDESQQRQLTLFNSPQVIDAFRYSKKVIVSLANNHMYDYPSKILETKNSLEGVGCGVFGICERDGGCPHVSDMIFVKHSCQVWSLLAK